MDTLVSKDIENRRVGRIQKVSEVMLIATLDICLKEVNSSLLKILQQNYVVLIDLVVELALQVVLCDQVPWT